MNWYKKHLNRISQQGEFPFFEEKEEKTQEPVEEIQTQSSGPPVFVSSDQHGGVRFRANNGTTYEFRGSGVYKGNHNKYLEFQDKVKELSTYTPGEAFNFAKTHARVGYAEYPNGSYKELEVGGNDSGNEQEKIMETLWRKQL